MSRDAARTAAGPARPSRAAAAVAAAATPAAAALLQRRRLRPTAAPDVPGGVQPVRQGDPGPLPAARRQARLLLRLLRPAAPVERRRRLRPRPLLASQIGGQAWERHPSDNASAKRGRGHCNGVPSLSAYPNPLASRRSPRTARPSCPPLDERITVARANWVGDAGSTLPLHYCARRDRRAIQRVSPGGHWSIQARNSGGCGATR